jgi:hypothetical protein
MHNPEIARLLAAALANKAEAQYTLGLAYLNGDGIAQNFAEAYFWLTVCSEAKGIFWSPSPEECAADAVLHLIDGDILDKTLNRVTGWFADHGDPAAGDF